MINPRISCEKLLIIILNHKFNKLHFDIQLDKWLTFLLKKKNANRLRKKLIII